MTHWPFIIAAYALTAVGTVAVLAWSYVDMRRAERAVKELERNK